ncbi:hypothetical protein HELRODRAFT_174345 [Helobdella robusta]|uniref:Uncharacterized protein n=1 Tax=Helobdella robusta TaxID=6412 RepID=T1F811_HELRO|nr:hypothetical protein HELRODRAFT_174345 [Helobdella robusta]ESO02894.1 hypothetical protein HELRODRAFT_174345 [Helobdella robusta]
MLFCEIFLVSDEKYPASASQKIQIPAIRITRDRRYENKYTENLYLTQLDHNMQKQGETDQRLAKDIERLKLLAHPTGTLEFRDRTATKAFTQAIRDLDMRYDLTISKITTLKRILEQQKIL